MELISGNTYWPNTLEQTLDFPPLAEDINCDVLIIGGGMGGSICSRLLGERQVDTVLIDKRGWCMEVLQPILDCCNIAMTRL